MAMFFNVATGKWEDDGTGVVNPVTAPPFVGPPVPPPLPADPTRVTVDSPLERMLAQGDEVTPADLVVNNQRAVYTPTGALAPAPDPSASAGLPAGPLVGGGAGGFAPEMGGAPAMGVPAPAQKPAPKSAGGGGGGEKPSKLEGDLARVQTEQEQALQGERTTAKSKAEAEAGIATDAVTAAKVEQARLAQQKQETEAEYARLSKTADDEDRKYKAMGFTDFWSKASIMGKPNTVTGARIVGLIATALGTAGTALSGGRNANYAVEGIDKLIANDYQRQRDDILKQKDTVNEARGLAKEAKAEKLLALENWRKNAYDLADREAKAKIAQMGPAAVDAKGASALADLHEKAIESKQALEKGQATLANIRADTALKRAEAARQRETTGANKPLTSDQAKSADLAGRMLQDNKIIDQTGAISPEGLEKLRNYAAYEQTLSNSPKARSAALLTGVLKTPEQFLSEKDQLAYNARKRFAASVLRGDSGAAISMHEYMDFDQQNFEQMGEKPASAQAKRMSREQMIQGKLRAAGPAATDVVNSVKTMQPQAAQAQARRGKVNGKPAMIFPDGHYELVQ